LILLGLAAVICFVVGLSLLFLVDLDESDDSVENPAVTIVPLPALLHSYQAGQLLSIAEGSLYFCVEADYETAEGYPPCNFNIHAFSGDVVEVVGKAEYFEKYEEWYWPVTGRRGSKYMVGEDGWIGDSGQTLTINELPPLRAPDFEVGEKLLLAYNFKLRTGPNGEQIIGRLGLPLIVYGGSKVEVLDGPVFGSDSSYWCQIAHLDYRNEERDLSYYPLGWVPCEFQRYDR
jgi:hypothetical protein